MNARYDTRSVREVVARGWLSPRGVSRIVRRIPDILWISWMFPFSRDEGVESRLLSLPPAASTLLRPPHLNVSPHFQRVKNFHFPTAYIRAVSDKNWFLNLEPIFSTLYFLEKILTFCEDEACSSAGILRVPSRVSCPSSLACSRIDWCRVPGLMQSAEIGAECRD